MKEKSKIDSSVTIDGVTTEYAAFGRGKNALVIIPGLSEGLKGIGGTAGLLSIYYRRLARLYRVYVIGRAREIPEGSGTREMALQLASVMDKLGLSKANICGISLGGMIAQHLTLLRPDLAGRLALVVSAGETNSLLKECVEAWINYAKTGDYGAIIRSTISSTYDPKKARRMAPLIFFLARIGKPKNFDRFIIQGKAAMEHSCRGRLQDISVPALVYSGGSDRIVGSDAGKKLAEEISGARLELRKELGHGAFEEDPDFIPLLIRFFQEPIAE